MHVCEGCKPIVISSENASRSTPNRKTKCRRCGKEAWCFEVVLITKEIEFNYTPCAHMKAIIKDLTIVEGWRDEPNRLKYHDLVIKDDKCPTCGNYNPFSFKTIEDWDVSGT